MLRAYKIESRAAVYPRILIDPDLFDQIKTRVRQIFLQLDSDGLWYVDPFSLNTAVDNASELAADGYDPHEIYLDQLGSHIEYGIRNAKQVDHFSKWTWMKLRYETAREDYLKTRETRLSKMM